MSLSENSNGLVMPVGPMYGGGSGSFGWNDGGLFWIIILFLFAFMGNGWGGYSGNQAPAISINNDLQRGFDQQSVMGSLNGLNAAVANGFANAEVSRCNTQANLLSTLNSNQNATTAAMNSLAMGLQQCCCDNRASVADLKYTVATEACADRQAVNDALRDVLAANAANTQMILDKMCQQEIDALKTQNANLQTQINLANLQASQSDQTARVLADNAAQTATLRQALNPAPIPAYVVQNPNGSACSPYYGCGCAV